MGMNKDINQGMAILVKYKKLIFILLTAVVLAAVAVVYLNGRSQSKTTPLSAVVQITANGFIPATLSVKPGTKVTWVNQDGQPHRVASNPHPTHTDTKGLDSPEVPAGGTYSFVFNGSGQHGYHDHLHPTTNGTLVVQ